MVKYSDNNPAFESTHGGIWWTLIGCIVLWGIYSLAAPTNATAPPSANGQSTYHTRVLQDFVTLKTAYCSNHCLPK